MNLTFRNDIQGLRAIAFITVFLFHLKSSFLEGGFVGVDVFFVISGFLMTSIIYNQKSKDKFRFIDFYKKRLFRIIPPMYFMTLVVMIVCSFFVLPQDVLTFRSSAVSAVLFISNIFFSNQGDYFGAGLSENPFLHTWSLSVEVQFYLLIPFLLFFVPNKFHKGLFIFLSLVILFYTSYLQYKEQSMYYSTIARIPEFFIGSLAFLFRQKLSKSLKNIFSILGLIIIIYACIFYSHSTIFPGFTAIIVCLGTLLIILSEDGIINKMISNKLFVHIGKLSYSLYLWHWPIIAIIKYYTDSEPFDIYDYVFITLLTYLLASISYHLTERKLSDWFYRMNIIYSISIVSIFSVLVYFSYSIFQLKTDKYFEMYARPHFGVESHNGHKLEKLGFLDDVNPNTLLIGDSHAMTCKLMFDSIAKNCGFSFETISADAYPPLEEIKYLDKNDPKFNKFYYENSLQIAKELSNILSKYQTIILQLENYDELKFIFLEKIFEKLRNDQKLILIESYPTLNHNPVRINKGYLKKSNLEFILTSEEVIPQNLLKLIENKNNVYLFSLRETKTLKNSIYYNDTTLYYDGGHINDLGSKMLAKEFANEFKLFWNQVHSK